MIGKYLFTNLVILSHASAHGVIFTSHATLLDVTHFHVDIGCHVNPVSPVITFGT
jgi:hypothetical protein